MPPLTITGVSPRQAVWSVAALIGQFQCRIVICDLEGRYIDQIGGNGPALRDGRYDVAAFNRPQGVAYSTKWGCLYVADTENHALREVTMPIWHPQAVHCPPAGLKPFQSREHILKGSPSLVYVSAACHACS